MISSQYNDRIRAQVIASYANVIHNDNIMKNGYSQPILIKGALLSGPLPHTILNGDRQGGRMVGYQPYRPQQNDNWKVGDPLNGVRPSTAAGTQAYSAAKQPESELSGGSQIAMRDMMDQVRGKLMYNPYNFNRNLKTNPEEPYMPPLVRNGGKKKKSIKK